MIKVIAFDFGGVLASEKDIYLSSKEAKIERMFGPNISDEEFFDMASNYVNKKSVKEITKSIINKLYYVKYPNIFKEIKETNNVKTIIATNHISYIKDFINNNFDTNYIDDIIVSSIIHRAKPNYDFYEYILEKYNIKANELLFLDDNSDNIKSAKELGINTILVNKNTNIIEKIMTYL